MKSLASARYVLFLLISFLLLAGPMQAQLKKDMPQRRDGKVKLHVERPLLPSHADLAWKHSQPGVPGGLPTAGELDALPKVNVLDYAADPTGQSVSDQAFSNALDAIPDKGGVLYIPAGTYLLSKTVMIQKPHIVIRGAGSPWDAEGNPVPEASVTRIYSSARGSCFHFSGNAYRDYQELPVSVKHGDRGVKVSKSSGFRKGGFAHIDIKNDSALMYTKAFWDQSWSKRMVGQVFEIESIHDDLLVFRNHANIDFPVSRQARISPVELLRNCGIEKLYIEKTAPKGNTLTFTYTAYCWVRDIESKRTRNQHVHAGLSIGFEIRDSYMHRSFYYGGGGSGYGVELGQACTGSLIENNVFDSLRHAMMTQLGANGNIFAYNYSTNSIQCEVDEKEFSEDKGPYNKGWDPPDISIHGHYPFMNLFEGNEVVEIGIGDWWGPAGPGNVYFRNRVYGPGIWYGDASQHQFVIGNLTTSIYSADKRERYNTEHGNVVNLEQQWNPDIPDRSLPLSLYLEEPPESFLQSDSTWLPWPLFGPDVDTKLPLVSQPQSDESMSGAAPLPQRPLPATKRYKNMIRNY